MTASHLTWAQARVAQVTYDNSARGNSFDEPLLRELVETLEVAASSPACAVIHLRMAGPHFCGGWDTRSFGSLAEAGPSEIVQSLRDSELLVDRIRSLPVPVVSGVRGRVIGFGAALLSAVHLPVSAESAELHMPETRFGFAPASVGHTLARALPRSHAYGLLSGLVRADGIQMYQWGLTAQVVPDADLDRSVDDLVNQLAEIPGEAVRAVIEVVESSRQTDSSAPALEASARTIMAAIRKETP